MSEIPPLCPLSETDDDDNDDDDNGEILKGGIWL